MIRNQINQGNSFGSHIFDNHVEQVTCDSFTAVAFFCIYCADIGCKVFTVMKVVFDNAHSANNFVIIQTKVPTVFCLSP